VVLEGLERIDIDSKNSSDWNHVKGSALYLRAKAFYNISQMFAKSYDPLTSHSDLGIPLRITSDLNAATTRSSVQQTYDRIQEDLKQAIGSLPSSTAFKTDPSKTSAYGLLARCYLSMGEYTLAELYADSSLTQYNALIDYNTINTGTLIPFTRFNTETIQFAQISPLYSVFIFLRQNYVPAELYNSYDDNDLRKVLFFHKLSEGNYSFKGSYDGGATPFTGIATDELFLIRAECRARAGNIEAAMQDLNTLLVTRYKTGTFVPTTAASVSAALDLILNERRKELIGRGLRWSDLRRLNKDPEYAITIVRTIDGTEYSLEPYDPRYVFAIPEYVINKTGIAQNVR
jgi:tetratricopeptide (TPR) repeat protein